MANFQTALQKQEEYQQSEYDAKLKYEKKIVSRLKTNCKPYFNYLKSKCKLRKTVGNLRGPLGKLSQNPQETADILANFFQSVFTEEQFGPLTEECYSSKVDIDSVMEDLHILPCDVKKVLLELDINKSMGPDNVHPKLIKYLGSNDNFVECITLLFNTCIKEESIPNIWKRATVIPLHKKGSVHLPDNYRPVSLTCILCKVYEKFIRKHLLRYLADLISVKQHGFVRGKSCLSNLLETLDEVNEILAEAGCVDGLYFDFAEAFNSVFHHRLLVKLEAMGVNIHFRNIISDFLSNRTMKVSVGDAKSEEKAVLSGVPQGSVLGPLLFLVFINDLPDDLKQIVKLFADDLKMTVNPRDLADIQLDLNKLYLWENKWLLKFNVSKCFVLHIGKSNPRNAYDFSKSVLKSIDKEKDLGVFFNKRLDFSDAK